MTEKKKKDAAASKLAPSQRVKGKRSERDLDVRLTDKEVLSKSDLVAKLHEEIGNLKIAKKARTEEMSGEIKAKEAAVTALVRDIRTRTEKRAVACEEELDFKQGLVFTKRIDTKQILDSRAMTATERTPTLFPIDGGKKDDGAERAPKGAKARKGAKATADASAATPA